MAEESGKIVFKLPGEDPEFEGLEEGETIERSVTIRKEPGGKACITEYEGMAMPEYDKESGDEEESEEGGDLIEMMNQEEME